jgi:DNA-binding NarL/FixJ family response regulator
MGVAASTGLTILVADDHALFRDGLRHVLTSFNPDNRVIEAADCAAALAVADAGHELALALVDLSLPGMGRFRGLAALRRRFKDVPVVVVSADDGIDDVRRAMACGVAGYIPKTMDSAAMKNALEQVLAGGTFLPPSARGWDAPERPPPAPRLTPRQRDVLDLIAKGHSNKRIAGELGLAEGTVKLHVAAVLKALGASNRTQAVLKATARGLVAGPPPAGTDQLN